MKKESFELSMLVVLIIFSIYFGYGRGFTGNVIADNDLVALNFYDLDSGCKLNGDVTLDGQVLGKTSDGVLMIEKNTVFQDIKNHINILGISDECFGKDSGIVFSQDWNIENLALILSSYDQINLKADLELRSPNELIEMQSYIRPDEAIGKLGSISKYFSGKELDDILIIISSQNLGYREDQLLFRTNDYWQTPKETLELGHGDCEDWATLTLSMIKAYDETLNCYAGLFSTHVSIICLKDDTLYLIDQDNVFTKHKIRKDKDLYEQKIGIRTVLDNYFDKYGIPINEQNIKAVFDMNTSIKFHNNEDFIGWIINPQTI